jgi:hypothetical protein
LPVGFIQGRFNFSLDVFDKPVKRFLEQQIRELGYDPRELLPVIEVAIEEAKKLVHEEKVLLPPRILRSRIEEHAYAYIHGVLSQSKKWKSAHECIRSYCSIFLVGAGISFESGIPLTKVLKDLVKFCGAEDYDELRRDREKCLRFKLEFKKICDKKHVGTSHKLIAKNFPEFILEIICLNWDNLIERAAKELGKSIHKVNEDVAVRDERYLWKFHGDIENIKESNIKGKGGWVFPNEGGYVFNCFLDYIKRTELKNRMFAFIIVGYSEGEKEIYENIIRHFEKEPPRPTFRIGLNLKRLGEENYIVGPADFILKQVLPIK